MLQKGSSPANGPRANVALFPQFLKAADLASHLLDNSGLLDHRVLKVTNTRGLDTLVRPAYAYALIAISNVNRAGAFRQGVSDTLGLESMFVRDGDEALQEIERHGPPALLVVDLSLPRVDGFAVVRKVRKQFAENETRIIAVAAHE